MFEGEPKPSVTLEAIEQLEANNIPLTVKEQEKKHSKIPFITTTIKSHTVKGTRRRRRRKQFITRPVNNNNESKGNNRKGVNDVWITEWSSSVKGENSKTEFSCECWTSHATRRSRSLYLSLISLCLHGVTIVGGVLGGNFLLGSLPNRTHSYFQHLHAVVHSILSLCMFPSCLLLLSLPSLSVSLFLPTRVLQGLSTGLQRDSDFLPLSTFSLPSLFFHFNLFTYLSFCYILLQTQATTTCTPHQRQGTKPAGQSGTITTLTW